MKAYIVTPLPIVSRGNAAYLYTVYNVLHFFSSILVELNFFIHSILYLRSTYKHSHDSRHLSQLYSTFALLNYIDHSTLIAMVSTMRMIQKYVVLCAQLFALCIVRSNVARARYDLQMFKKQNRKINYN